MDKETLLETIRKIARETGRETFSISEFTSKSGISKESVLKHFDNWNEAIEAAGLKPTDVRRISDTELFREMKNVFMKFGGIPTKLKFNKLCKYSSGVYIRHFGQWNKVLLAFKAWVEESGEDFPYIDKLQGLTEVHETKETIPSGEGKTMPVSWDSRGTMIYGAFLYFRGLQHAPVNEQGVVFLFGMICNELGFIVKAVRTGYPDCEAKRRVNRRRDEWERVRIEFEYCSSNFRNQGLDPAKCDVIVCWQHDWPECPLEVIELKTEIQKLSNRI